MSDSPLVENAIRQFYGSAAWLRKDITELSEEELLFQPNGDRSHIYWLYGHIVGSIDIACFINGEEKVIGPEYSTHFGMGTVSQKTAEAYPSIQELQETFEKCLERSINAIKSLSDSDLELPPTGELPGPLKEYFKTREDIITGFSHHLAYHSGQIGMIMKMLGK